MSEKTKNIIQKENITQAIIVADTFNDEFLPVSDTIPLVRYFSLTNVSKTTYSTFSAFYHSLTNL